MANRTGVPQEEQIITLGGAELIDELLLGEQFRRAEQIFGPVFTTVLRFFDAPVGGVPPTEDANPPLTTLCRTGFAVTDHEFIMLGWTWAGFPATPTVPITDPSVSVRRLAGNMVLVELFNSSGRPVIVTNFRLSQSMFRPDLNDEVLDPLFPPDVIPPFQPPPNGNNQVTALIGPIIIPPQPPPVVQPTREMSSTQPILDIPGETLLTAPMNFALPPQQTAEIMVMLPSNNPDQNVVARASLLDGTGIVGGAVALNGVKSSQNGDDNVPRADPISWAVRAQPFRFYAPFGFDVQATPDILMPADGQLAPVEVVVCALDPDSSRDATRNPPVITLDQVTAPGDNLFDSSDVVFNPATDLTTTRIVDPAGRSVTCATARLQLRRETKDRMTLRFYDIRFRLVDDQGQVGFATARVEVRPPGAPFGGRLP
jgi:hypothetical protein